MSNYQVIYRGIFHDGQGYAVAARGYALALDKIGVDVKIQAVNFNTLPVKIEKNTYEKIIELSRKPLDPEKKKVLIHHIQPGGLEKDIGKYDYIINNVVFEPDKIHKEWVPLLNQIDQVWVPSKHNQKIFKDSGIKVPVNVFPHGVDFKFHPVDSRIDLGDFNDWFKFLCVATWSYRKNLKNLIKSFYEEFKDDEVCLILRIYSFIGQSKDRMLREIASIKDTVGFCKCKVIVILNDYLNDQHMNELYNTCDCYVLPTRSEGVGLPYMEAMACGKPCIATGWGGQTDFINNENGYLIDYEMKEIDLNELDAGIYFRDYMRLAEPNIDHLKQLMRHAYENPEELKQKGIKSMIDISKFTWEDSARKMKETLDQLVSGR